MIKNGQTKFNLKNSKGSYKNRFDKGDYTFMMKWKWRFGRSMKILQNTFFKKLSREVYGYQI